MWFRTIYEITEWCISILLSKNCNTLPHCEKKVLLTLKMASNFIRDLSSFSKGAKSLFSLDSTKNPYQWNVTLDISRETFINKRITINIISLYVIYEDWKNYFFTHRFVTQNFQHAFDGVGRDLGQQGALGKLPVRGNVIIILLFLITLALWNNEQSHQHIPRGTTLWEILLQSAHTT